MYDDLLRRHQVAHPSHAHVLIIQLLVPYRNVQKRDEIGRSPAELAE